VVTISGTPTSTLPAPLFPYTIQTVGNACVKANAAGSIRVNPYPVPNFTIDKPSYCIPNAIVGFINGSTMPDGSGMTYIWNFGDGPGTSTAVNPSHWYTSQGPFNVTLTVKSTTALTPSGVGCAKSVIIPINNIHPQPKADFSFNKPSVCVGDDVTLTDHSDGKDGVINQWVWDMGDASIYNTSTVTHTYADTITFTVKLYTVNTIGCNSDTVSKLFTVYPYPHVNAGPDRVILEGGQITLESVTFANDAQYLWTPSLYLIDNKVARPKVNRPLTDMTYTLTVTARGGCSASDNVFVKLLKFPVIPNTFTPNNDGINDTWRIDYLNTYPDNRVQVFTRSGQLVFESRGYNTPWDGTLKGKPLPFDTYYYIIEPGNGRDPITGYVTILK
jgi:gliding motility-associated-like protein